MNHYQQELWSVMWGRDYDFDGFKNTEVRSVVETLDVPQGGLALDYGSGIMPVSLMVPATTHPDFRSILIDGAIREDQEKLETEPAFADARSPRAIPFQADIDELVDPDSMPRQSLESLIRRSSRDGEPVADFAVLSEILNYVDAKRTLEMAATLLRESGLAVIVNMPGRGPDRLFSPDRVRSHADVMNGLHDNGLAVQKVVHSCFPDGKEAPLITVAQKVA